MREDDGFAIHWLLRHSREGLNLTPYVIPAQAGIHSNVFVFLKASDSKTKSWIPASITAPCAFSNKAFYLLHLTTMEGGNVIFCMEQN
jgi:hypothetical protein